MPIGIEIDMITGLPKCPCCRLNLHHCEKCWNKYHNGIAHKDYVPPEYYGEPFISEEITKKINEDLRKMALELGREFKEKELEVKPDKDREYKEGDYNH